MFNSSQAEIDKASITDLLEFALGKLKYRNDAVIEAILGILMRIENEIFDLKKEIELNAANKK